MVYPEFPDTFWSFKHALSFIRKKASFPPLGLLTVAAMLPKSWEKRLVDMNVKRLSARDLEWADYVFVSAMVAQRDSTIEVVRRCHGLGVKVVAGGPLFTAEYESFPEIHHFVLGEAEGLMARFAADLESGRAERIYQAEGFPELTLTPVPLWELADLNQYSSMCIQYSRGCPFDCEFCNITALLGHRPRTKSVEQIIAELDSLHALGWQRGVFFVDDNFIGNKAKLKKEVLPALIAWRQGKKGFEFQTEVSINLADDPELMDLMARAGFAKVFVGIETPDEASLAECNKIQNKGRDLVAAVKTLQRAGMEVQGGFIVGFDSDTPSIFQRQIDFIQRSGIVTAMVGLLQAPYGTRLYERVRDEGRLVGDFTGNNTDNTMNFTPMMDPTILHQGYEKLVSTIYSPREYYQRVRTFLREYHLPPSVSPVLGREYILAFFRSILRIGVLDKSRIEYWKLLTWTLFRKPKLFAMAVTLAIYGFHFQRICDKYVGNLASA
jgi:radical SAM superfamily enzyme YgiQ (UPF0313 family)